MTTQRARHLKILDMLSKNKRLQVTDLSEKLGVSLVTVRKDLTELENKKLLLRYQGYVELNTNTPVNRRMLSHYEKKTMIAKEAVKLINDGDAVFIESGSSCIILAEELKASGKKVTIITNSTFMADFISPCTNIRLILLGGEYQPDSMAVVGAVTKNCLKSFHARYFFSGTDGYFPGSGFTGDNPERVEILRMMAEQSEKTVVITESEKFLRAGTMTVFSLKETDIVITDNQITPDTQKELESNNIKVIKS